MTKSEAVALAAVGALAIPATAGAATKVVGMGEPVAAQKTFQRQYNADVNDFFPHGIKIHVGDSIRFVPNGFHTVDLEPRGGKPLQGFIPAGPPVAGSTDAAGAPFWFNGRVNPANPNPMVFGGGGLGKSFVYDGSKRVESGPPLGGPDSGPPKPMTVKFTKAGSYTYFCNIHDGMKGIVHVVAARAKVPAPKADARALSAQIARDLGVAKTLLSVSPPAGTVQVGAAGEYGVEAFAFFPGTITLPVGSTLRFAMPSHSTEAHTASTGPGDPSSHADTTSYLAKLAASLQGPMPDPRLVFPSDPLGSIASLTPTLHGNGFWSTGFMFSPGPAPLPSSGTVKFAAPGTFVFHCLIHTFMKGTVIVK